MNCNNETVNYEVAALNCELWTVPKYCLVDTMERELGTVKVKSKL